MYMEKRNNNRHFVKDMIHQSKNSKSWYAICLKSLNEIFVHTELQDNGIKSSLPMSSVIRQWSDRKKKIVTCPLESVVNSHQIIARF